MAPCLTNQRVPSLPGLPIDLVMQNVPPSFASACRSPTNRCANFRLDYQHAFCSSADDTVSARKCCGSEALKAEILRPLPPVQSFQPARHVGEDKSCQAILNTATLFPHTTAALCATPSIPARPLVIVKPLFARLSQSRRPQRSPYREWLRPYDGKVAGMRKIQAGSLLTK